nr:immunoglobulin heavy chain junction region [Macaca mulatta]MOX38739.1 immunoglobulin heavy chain junction region [Macaca mulatta]MOX38997.1 immunoglobulin heavy chain junction region [Macaca mulatta]MOX41316.1 immunoglobulin heavy chain junction region [Macaca mulatta]
CVIMMISAW